MTKGKWAVFLFYEVIKGSYGSYQSAVDNKIPYWIVTVSLSDMKEINLIQPIIGDIYNNRRGIIFFRRNSKNKKGQNYFKMVTPTLVDCWLVHSWVEQLELLNQLLMEQQAIQFLLLSFQIPSKIINI